MSGKQKGRGRKDHYIPQGFLRGFIDPSRIGCEKPLWCLDLASQEWAEKSTIEVGWEKGFYDYAGTFNNLEHPDATFRKFEHEFPLVRERLLQRRYKGWVKQQKPFLLGYMQMMRARSPLFIQQQTLQNRNIRAATVVGVGPGNQIQVDSLELRPLSETSVRNSVISNMRQEIQKGPDWMLDLNWCLRYATSPTDSFVTGPSALVLESPAHDIVTAMTHPETTIWFPLCWQACLIGSPSRFDQGTDKAHPTLLTHVRSLFCRPADGYVVSACRFTVKPD